MNPEFGLIDHFTVEHYTHVASLVLYSIVFAFAADTLRDAPKARHKTLRGIIRSFLILVAAVATVFGGIQAWWVMNNGPEVVPDPTAFAWLIFDWANGLAYFAFVSAVRVYLRWQPPYRPCQDAPDACPRRKELREARYGGEPGHSAQLRGLIDQIESAHSASLTHRGELKCQIHSIGLTR